MDSLTCFCGFKQSSSILAYREGHNAGEPTDEADPSTQDDINHIKSHLYNSDEHRLFRKTLFDRLQNASPGQIRIVQNDLRLINKVIEDDNISAVPLHLAMHRIEAIQHIMVKKLSEIKRALL